ncbi:uncharacterized protein LOC120344440 [Styela clava]
MDFVEVIFFITLICGLFAEKLPDGVCITKIVNGKLVQVGDCKKNDGSDIFRLIQKNLDEKKQIQDKCNITYNSKCYRVVVYDTLNVTFTHAESICKSMNNGEPSNIYDFQHFNVSLSYLSSLVTARRKFVSIWTGMEYKNNQLLLSDGKSHSLPAEVWSYPTNPSPDVSLTNVVVAAREGSGRLYQGMSNNKPSATTYGVMCEV